MFSIRKSEKVRSKKRFLASNRYSYYSLMAKLKRKRKKKKSGRLSHEGVLLKECIF